MANPEDRFSSNPAHIITGIWCWVMAGPLKVRILENTVFQLISAYAWVKVFRNNPEFKILRLTFHRKSASKC